VARGKYYFLILQDSGRNGFVLGFHNYILSSCYIQCLMLVFENFRAGSGSGVILILIW
jgi:hypothetical protein